jgi:hypothetical protein
MTTLRMGQDCSAGEELLAHRVSPLTKTIVDPQNLLIDNYLSFYGIACISFLDLFE